LPRRWGLTQATGSVGGAHAGYRVYPCKDGRVAVAALEPHFAAALCAAAGVARSDVKAMFAKDTHAAVAAFFAGQTREELDRLAVEKDLPIHTMA
jgi:crotonobetainyl-CoA:carnitine CoA-transferase CaiB-like acyl-CoA transferase